MVEPDEMEKISHVKFLQETSSKFIWLHLVGYPKQTTGSTMVHFFDPIGHAIRVSKQLGERYMIGANLKQTALLTLLPVRLVERPRERAP